MKSKRGFQKRFLEILNSKPIIGLFIFLILGIAMVVAGDVVVKEGEMNIEEGLVVNDILYINTTNNNVGIGTNSPLSGIKLDIDGQMRSKNSILWSPSASGWVAQLKFMTIDGLSTHHVFFIDRGDNDRLNLDLNRNGTSEDIMRIRGGIDIDDSLTIDNYLGVGLTNPNQSVDVNGNVQALDFITISDREQKDNIKELNVNEVFSSTPKLYEYQFKKQVPVYDEDEENVLSYTTELMPPQVGLMMDEVPEECRKGKGVDNYCMLSLAYTQIISLQNELCTKDNSYSWC